MTFESMRSEVSLTLIGAWPGAGTVDGEKSDAERKNRAEAFREIFFAAIESVDRNHQRHRALRILRQAQVADDLLALERNVHDFERRIEKLGVIEERFEGFLIRALLAGRRGNRPASERIKPPGADVIGVGFGRDRISPATSLR
jgi:hypothetical protein